MNDSKQPLILGSTSPYRKELLERLRLPFATAAPDIDETPREGETPQALVARLARGKAEAVAAAHAGALIIGSDQVAVLDGAIVGKPGGHEAAVGQLQRASGRTVTFFTGLCLLNSTTGTSQCEVVPFRVTFRHLSEAQIQHYLKREQPYNCAGSFKSEGMGVALFESMDGEDPSALMGLPLIRLTRMLEREGVEVL